MSEESQQHIEALRRMVETRDLLIADMERENRKLRDESSETWNEAVEAALLKLPGGNYCDPQEAADEIRQIKVEINETYQAHRPLSQGYHEPATVDGPVINQLRQELAAEREARKALQDAADMFSAEQDRAPHPSCGLVQPVSVADCEALNAALALAAKLP